MKNSSTSISGSFSFRGFVSDGLLNIKGEETALLFTVFFFLLLFNKGRRKVNFTMSFDFSLHYCNNLFL